MKTSRLHKLAGLGLGLSLFALGGGDLRAADTKAGYKPEFVARLKQEVKEHEGRAAAFEVMAKREQASAAKLNTEAAQLKADANKFAERAKTFQTEAEGQAGERKAELQGLAKELDVYVKQDLDAAERVSKVATEVQDLSSQLQANAKQHRDLAAKLKSQLAAGH